MNLMVVGMSHRTAPVDVLERVAIPVDEAPEMLRRLLAGEHLAEAVVLSTCNRVEVYAGVTSFHGGLTDITAQLAQRAGGVVTDLAPHLYVHYDIGAVRHAYEVATGLDSMVVGEAQVLGQLREAYAVATAQDATGRLLHELMQQALRVGKRAHTETGIDRAGQSVVSAALDLVGDLTGRPALVIGAGSMGALALATLQRRGAGPLWVTSRNPARAQRLARLYGANPLPAPDLSLVDLVVTATASTGHILSRADVKSPVTLVDLAVPRDIDPSVADLPGVELIDIARVGTALSTDTGWSEDVAAVREIVSDEVETFFGWLRGADTAPTVAALRARADDVVAAELARLGKRRPELSDDQRADVAQAVHRVVQRLLHQPTVRVRELAAGPGGQAYPALLRELFDLRVPETGSVADVPEVADLSEVADLPDVAGDGGPGVIR